MTPAAALEYVRSRRPRVLLAPSQWKVNIKFSLGWVWLATFNWKMVEESSCEVRFAFYIMYVLANIIVVNMFFHLQTYALYIKWILC